MYSKISLRRESSTKLINLQWLRFFAALMVLLYHASVYLQMARQSDFAVAFIPSWFGAVGVALFFALSGNLMASSMMKTSAPRFLLHRVGRIYPAFFLVTALAVAASQFLPLGVALDLHALSLFPYGASSYPLGVEWTLVFEIAFYVFVFLLIFFGKTSQATSFLVGWLALILMNNVLHPDNPAVNVFPPLELPLVSLNVSFAIGMLLPLVFKRHVPHPILAALISFSLFKIGQTHSVVGVRWAMGMGSALFVLSLTQFEGCPWLRGQRSLSWLGDKLGSYSYALYLCHVPVIRTLYATFGDSRVEPLFYIAVLLSLLIAVPIGEADLRMYRAIKVRVDRSAGLVPWALTGLYITAFAGATLLAIGTLG